MQAAAETIAEATQASDDDQANTRVDAAFASNLDDLLAERGLTWAQLAQATGWSHQRVSSIATYGAILSRADLHQLAAALRVPIMRLFKDEHGQSFLGQSAFCRAPRPSPAANSDAAEAANLARRLLRLPQPARDSLLAVIRALETVNAPH